ncbi:MAG: GntR family transcriptional regulator [Pseudomonadota bacterium]
MSAARKAYDIIRADIIEGRYAPGDRITEGEVATTAAVSRTPVREALHRLEAEGLIRFVPNQGAFVASWGVEEAEEIFELRARLECYAVELCAQRASDAALAELRDLAERQLVAATERPRGYLKKIADLNSRFHTALLHASNSEQLRASMATLANAPLVFQTFRDYSEESLARSARHHLELVEALEARNPDWAAGVMRAHIYAARSVFRNVHQSRERALGQKTA